MSFRKHILFNYAVVLRPVIRSLFSLNKGYNFRLLLTLSLKYSCFSARDILVVLNVSFLPRCTNSAGPSDICMNIVGLDTLEEEEEKARFFAQLEAGASSTIDYSKLNRELDSASSTIATDLRCVLTLY